MNKRRLFDDPFLVVLPAIILGCLLTMPMSVLASGDANKALATAVEGLKVQSFQEKEQAITALEQVKDPRMLKIMRAMLEGRLYFRKSDGRVVITAAVDEGYQITDVITGEDLGAVSKRKLKKISVNNKLRRVLRGVIARLNLFSDKPAERLAALRQMMGHITPESVTRLRRMIDREDDKAVIEAIHINLALIDIGSAEKIVRLQAISVLADSMEPEARNRLASFLKKTPEGGFIESDQEIRKAVTEALQSIDSKLSFYSFVETTFFGLSLGSVLLLIAVGLAITFGVMGVINMAHGELMMLGAYTTYVVQLLMPNHIDLSLFVAIPAAFIVAGLFGIAIERGVIRFLYSRPLETLLATFGISLILQQLVRTVISAQNVTVSNPSWMSGSLEVNAALSITYNRLYILVFALLVFFALLLILKKTALGLQVRAVAQNRGMARAMGIRTEWVDAMTFGLGSGIAGVAGVALSQLTNVGPNMGQSYIIDSFMVVVFGGVGNLWGTLVGALTLGVVNKYLEPWAGAVLAKILVLVFIILFIQKRPRGLFPKKGRAAET